MVRRKVWPQFVADVFFCLVALFGAAAQTQPGEPASAPPASAAAVRVAGIDLSGEWTVRGQVWNWFQDQNRVKYAFGQSVLRLALNQLCQRLDWRVEIEQPTLFALPEDAQLPGMGNALGLGGLYYAANNGRENTASAFLKQAFVDFKGFAANGGYLRVGRFEFSDSGQIVPADPTLAFVKRDRLAGRLIGDADWYGIGRSFDGANLLYEFSRNTSVTLMGARPTRGVFDVNGMGELDVDTQYADLTRELPAKESNTEIRIFAIGYHDGRPLLKLDNRPPALREADTKNIRIGTFGAHWLMAFGTPIGGWDLTAWGAWQMGSAGPPRRGHYGRGGLAAVRSIPSPLAACGGRLCQRRQQSAGRDARHFYSAAA